MLGYLVQLHEQEFGEKICATGFPGLRGSMCWSTAASPDGYHFMGQSWIMDGNGEKRCGENWEKNKLEVLSGRTRGQ